MAETKEKKGFNAALYAVIAGIVVAVLLALITIFAFTTRYTGFSAEKVAQAEPTAPLRYKTAKQHTIFKL